MKTAKNSRSKLILAALAGVAVVLGAAAALVAGLGRSALPVMVANGPERDIRALSAALSAHDGSTAMNYINFDALLDDVNARDIVVSTHMQPDDPRVKQMMAGINAQARRIMYGQFIDQLKSAENLKKAQPGTLLGCLVSLDGKKIVRVSNDTAYVEFPDKRKVMFARETGTGTWRVVGFQGYEDDMAKYQEVANQALKDSFFPKDQLKKSADTNAPAPASGTSGTDAGARGAQKNP